MNAFLNGSYGIAKLQPGACCNPHGASGIFGNRNLRRNISEFSRALGRHLHRSARLLAGETLPEDRYVSGDFASLMQHGKKDNTFRRILAGYRIGNSVPRGVPHQQIITF